MTGCGPREPSVDIWTACATGNTAAVKQHIRFGTDLDAAEPKGGSSPLIVAALVGQTEVVRLLVENGANINFQNGELSTALHTAAFFCHRKVVEYLLDHGADRELVNVYGRTPLGSVAGEWNDEVAGRYMAIAGALRLPIDLEQIRVSRPIIADLLRQNTDG
jgi:ankyrin repeat protein